MRRPRLFSAVAVALLALVYFGATAARDLQPFDSAEFVLNATQFGVGHPPGQPLYLLVSALAARMAPLPAPFVLSLFSVAITAMIAAFTLWFVRGREEAGVGLLLAASTFLVPGVWDMATRPEVYPLATFPLLGAFLLFAGIRDLADDGRQLAGSFLLIALAASVNPAMALCAAFAFLPALVSLFAARPTGRSLWALAVALVIGALGLIPYSFLPAIAADPKGAIVWGEPLRGGALVHYLLGRDYRSWHLTLSELLGNLRSALAWLVTQGLAAPIVLGLFGFVRSDLPRRIKSIPMLLCALSLITIALNHPFIPTNPDYDGYLLPSLFVSIVGVGLLLRPLLARRRGQALAASLVVALAAQGALSGTPLLSRERSDDGSRTRQIASSVLESTPENGILLLESDHLVFPILYLNEVRHERRDVTVVNVGWTNSSWYWRHLAAIAPSLPPMPEASTRDERLSAWLARAGRPVAAERIALAALAGRPTNCEFIAVAGGPCPTPSAPRHAGLIVSDDSWPLAGSLDERVFSQFHLERAEDAWLLGDLSGAYRHLRGALPFRDPDLPPVEVPRVFQVSPAPPDLVAATRFVRTRLDVPLALATPQLLLLRLGDLLSAVDPAAAASCYERSGLPEADRAIAGLAVRTPVSSVH